MGATVAAAVVVEGGVVSGVMVAAMVAVVPFDIRPDRRYYSKCNSCFHSTSFRLHLRKVVLLLGDRQDSDRRSYYL